MAHHLRALLAVLSFSVTVTRFFEIPFLRAAYPSDWLNAPGLAFETATMVKMNSTTAELAEIETRVELVYPVFAAALLFQSNLSAFQLPIPVPVGLSFRSP
jgi:hypothetical protein